MNQDRMIVVDRLNRYGLPLGSYTLLAVLAHVLQYNCPKRLVVKKTNQVANVIPSHAIALQLLHLFEVKVLVRPLLKGHGISLLFGGATDLTR
jgi:ABC-type sulfate transport system permease component